jgi:hypothetical protein
MLFRRDHLIGWFFGVMAILCSDALGATTTLTPVADTTLIEAAPANNLGGQYYANAGTTQAGKKNRALFRFEPREQIPAGSKITSAKLVFLVVGEPSETPSNPSEFQLYRVLKSWGEGSKIDNKGPDNGGLGQPATFGEASWVYRFSGTTNTWSSPGGVIGVDFSSVISSSQFIYGVISPPYPFNSTSNMVADVQLWLDSPEQNFGWMLKTIDESVILSARRFGSKDNLADAPQLEIEFVPPPKLSATLSANTLNLGVAIELPGTYVLQSSGSLNPPSWLSITNVVINSATNVSVSCALTATNQFYRVIAQ